MSQDSCRLFGSDAATPPRRLKRAGGSPAGLQGLLDDECSEIEDAKCSYPRCRDPFGGDIRLCEMGTCIGELHVSCWKEYCSVHNFRTPTDDLQRMCHSCASVEYLPPSDDDQSDAKGQSAAGTEDTVEAAGAFETDRTDCEPDGDDDNYGDSDGTRNGGINFIERLAEKASEWDQAESVVDEEGATLDEMRERAVFKVRALALARARAIAKGQLQHVDTPLLCS